MLFPFFSFHKNWLWQALHYFSIVNNFQRLFLSLSRTLVLRCSFQKYFRRKFLLNCSLVMNFLLWLSLLPLFWWNDQKGLLMPEIFKLSRPFIFKQNASKNILFYQNIMTKILIVWHEVEYHVFMFREDLTMKNGPRSNMKYFKKGFDIRWSTKPSLQQQQLSHPSNSNKD